MHLTAKSRPFGLLMIGAIVALVSACSTSDGANPTLTTPISSSVTNSPSQTVTSTSSQTSMSSSVTNTSPPQSTAASPWPADLTPDQVAAAQAAIAAYVGYFKLVDQAYADPSRDWSADAAQVAAAVAESVDYFCVGPCWPTPTKPGRTAPGLPLVRIAAATDAAKPWFAIGGIDEQRLPEVLDAGARRVVVVRAIAAADDPQAAASRLKARLAEAG